MEVLYETIADAGDGQSACAVFRLAATNDSWRLPLDEIEQMLNGDRERDGVTFPAKELERGLHALQSMDI